MCQATSIGNKASLIYIPRPEDNFFFEGGLTRDISSLVVQEQPTPSKQSENDSANVINKYVNDENLISASPNEERRFFAFHDWGVSVYEPSTCRLYHRIQSTDIIPGTQVIFQCRTLFNIPPPPFSPIPTDFLSKSEFNKRIFTTA